MLDDLKVLMQRDRRLANFLMPSESSQVVVDVHSLVADLLADLSWNKKSLESNDEWNNAEHAQRKTYETNFGGICELVVLGLLLL